MKRKPKSIQKALPPASKSGSKTKTGQQWLEFIAMMSVAFGGGILGAWIYQNVVK